MTKIKPCICGHRSRLSRESKGVFNFAKIHCSHCGRRTYWGEYMWLSMEDREACIKEWNDAIDSRIAKAKKERGIEPLQ